MDGIKYELENNDNDDETVFSELHTELICYLEYKVRYGLANNDELILYEDFKLFDCFDVGSDICEQLIQEMQTIYNNGVR